MTLQLTDSELKVLVRNHISELVNIPQDRLKVTFNKRQSMTDTVIEILKPGQPKSIIDGPAETEPQDEVAQDESTTEQSKDVLSMLK